MVIRGFMQNALDVERDRDEREKAGRGFKCNLSCFLIHSSFGLGYRQASLQSDLSDIDEFDLSLSSEGLALLCESRS